MLGEVKETYDETKARFVTKQEQPLFEIDEMKSKKKTEGFGKIV